MFMSNPRTKASQKYNEKTYERVYLHVLKGQKEIIAAHAAAQGESVNAFINRAIKNQIALDKKAE